MADIVPSSNSSNSGYKSIGVNDELPVAHQDGFSPAVTRAASQPLLVVADGVSTQVDMQQLAKNWQKSGMQNFSLETTENVLSVLQAAKPKTGNQMDPAGNSPAPQAWPSALPHGLIGSVPANNGQWPQQPTAGFAMGQPYGQAPQQFGGMQQPPGFPDMQMSPGVFPPNQPGPHGAFPPGYGAPPNGIPGMNPWMQAPMAQVPTMLATINLTTPEPPNIDVFFDMDAGGALTSWYHAVIPSDKGLLLIFDTRSRGASQFVPPEGRPITVRCAALGDRQVAAASCGLSFTIGTLEVVVLIFLVESKEQVASRSEDSEALANLMASVLK